MLQFEHPYFIILMVLPALVYFFFKSSGPREEEAPTLITPNYNKLVDAFGKNTGSVKVITKFKSTKRRQFINSTLDFR